MKKNNLIKYLFKLAGWEIAGELPYLNKYIIIGAPHTSNLDFVIMIMLSLYYKKRFFWMGKHTLFKTPFKRLFLWLGGIPIRRHSKNNTVEQVIDIFKDREEIILIITPEGTRGWVPHWKSGFYYISIGAKVPVLLGFIDYRIKKAGFGPLIYLTGDIEKDMKVIRDFYKDKSGRYPANMGEIRLKN